MLAVLTVLFILFLWIFDGVKTCCNGNNMMFGFMYKYMLYVFVYLQTVRMVLNRLQKPRMYRRLDLIIWLTGIQEVCRFKFLKNTENITKNPI